MINVVVFSANFDTGGQGYSIKRAFDRHQPDFCVRSLHSAETYFGYQYDLRYRATEAYKLFEAAEIFHLRNSFQGYKRFNLDSRPVGLVLHHHGTKFRGSHHELAETARELGAVQIASTMDLAILEPDVEWLPAPFDLDVLAALRATEASALGSPLHQFPHYVRIAHSPTNREVKSTNLIMDAVQTLARRGLPVVFDLIERRTYRECLERKAKADILVDQLELGYGNSSIEAWGMGIPVIAGVESTVTREAMLSCWGGLPFYEATKDTLVDRLEELVVDAELRRYWGYKGLAHVRRWHDEKVVSDQLAGIYRSVLERVS